MTHDRNKLALKVLDATEYWLRWSLTPHYREPLFQTLHKGFFKNGEERFIYTYRWPTQTGYYVYLAAAGAEWGTPDNPVIYMEWRGKGMSKRSVLEPTNIANRDIQYYFDRLWYQAAYRRAVTRGIERSKIKGSKTK